MEKTEECWLWQGSSSHGYGTITEDGKRYRVHRLSYEYFIGPIPDGLQLDHLCRNTLCIRPDHLEPVTNFENTLRGENFIAEQVRRTHCPRGHPYDMTTGGKRKCSICQRVFKQAFEERKRAAATSAAVGSTTLEAGASSSGGEGYETPSARKPSPSPLDARGESDGPTFEGSASAARHTVATTPSSAPYLGSLEAT